jgi:hypothetical protein
VPVLRAGCFNEPAPHVALGCGPDLLSSHRTTRFLDRGTSERRARRRTLRLSAREGISRAATAACGSCGLNHNKVSRAWISSAPQRLGLTAERRERHARYEADDLRARARRNSRRRSIGLRKPGPNTDAHARAAQLQGKDRRYVQPRKWHRRALRESEVVCRPRLLPRTPDARCDRSGSR